MRMSGDKGQIHVGIVEHVDDAHDTVATLERHDVETVRHREVSVDTLDDAVRGTERDAACVGFALGKFETHEAHDFLVLFEREEVGETRATRDGR